MLSALALTLLLAAPPTDAPRLVVLDLQRVGAATDAEAASLNDVIVQLVTRTSLFQVVSQRDIATLLGVERQKQLLGCTEESANCLTELSGALDARYILSGTLNRIGATYQLTLQALDSRRGQPIGRSLKVSKSLEELRGLLPWAVADATGGPQPQPPSRVGPVLLLVAGGLALAAGGTVLFQTETREQAVLRELAPTSPTTLRSLTDYRADAQDFAVARTASLALILVGAVVAGSGAWWYLTIPDVAKVALLPRARASRSRWCSQDDPAHCARAGAGRLQFSAQARRASRVSLHRGWW